MKEDIDEPTDDGRSWANVADVLGGGDGPSVPHYERAIAIIRSHYPEGTLHRVPLVRSKRR